MISPPVFRLQTHPNTTIRVCAFPLNGARFEGFHSEVEHQWDYADFLKQENRNWFKGWTSFDCLLADDERNVVWCGITNFATDIFHVFDRKTEQFESLNFASVADRYDAKFHRSLEFDREGNIWAATSLLHDIDRYLDCAGRRPRFASILIRARSKSSIAPSRMSIFRASRSTASGACCMGKCLRPSTCSSMTSESRKFKELGLVGSGFAMGQSQTLAIDRNGAVWGTWNVTCAWLYTPGNDQFRLWHYHPDRGRIQFLDYGLPTLSGRNGFAHADGIHTGPDGAIYMGTAEGLLCRIDPDDHKIAVIGKPGPHRRLAAMANGPDGRLYGSAGQDGAAKPVSV